MKISHLLIVLLSLAVLNAVAMYFQISNEEIIKLSMFFGGALYGLMIPRGEAAKPAGVVGDSVEVIKLKTLLFEANTALEHAPYRHQGLREEIRATIA